MNDYYVYVYIDPRNFEEFYYGKGRGSRKEAHLKQDADTLKVKRIAEIRKAGEVPIIRVIARGLSEDQALLIEKTLLWKLGKYTTNIATGYFAKNFRPANSYHKKLQGFDYQNGIYYYNVGEGVHRNWDDYREFGFISAGQGVRWRDAMKGFNIGDICIAYLKKHGFVGVGRIKTEAAMIADVLIEKKGKPLLALPLRSKRMGDNSGSETLSEYVCLVDWIRTFPREQAKRRKSPKLYTTTHVRASLEGQPETVKFIEEKFDVNLSDLIR